MYRVLFSGIVSAIAYFLIRDLHLNLLEIPMILYDTFALTFLISNWIVILFRPVAQIRKWARQEDGSKAFVFLLVLLTSFASIAMVVALTSSGQTRESNPVLYLSLSVLGVLLSWALLHTIFAFHYAHLYYDDDDDGNSTADAGGLDFPGGGDEPDYLEFAYFAFVIGMTFQVSDVTTTSKRMRRLVLVHGLLSFALNTFVVALTINVIASLRG